MVIRQWAWGRLVVKDVDRSLYQFLTTLYDLRLISHESFQEAVVCPTRLLEVEEYDDDH